MNESQPTPKETPVRRPRTELITLVFTDIVCSTALKQQLGDKAGAASRAPNTLDCCPS
jgi:hypothetical protein